MENINMHYYDKKKYIIDTSKALAELSQHTMVKKHNNSNKLLIYGSINQAVCKFPSGNLIKVVSTCNPYTYIYYDQDDKHITLGVDTVKVINKQQLTLLKRILQIDSSITKKDWLELEAIRKKNERKLKHLSKHL